MPKGKITKLGSPDNPYGKKVSAAQASASKRASDATTPKRPQVAKSSKAAPKPGIVDSLKAGARSQIKDLSDRYGGGHRKRMIDDAIEGRPSSVRRKK